MFEAAIIWVRWVYDKIVIESLKKIKDGNKRDFYMTFHLKVCLGVKFTAYEIEMMKEALTSHSLYDACCSFTPRVQ